MPFVLEILKENKLKFFIFLLCSFCVSLMGVGILIFINKYMLTHSENIPIFYFAAMLIIFFLSSFLVEISLSIFGQNFIFNMQKRVVKQILDTPLLQIAAVGKARILASLSSDVRNVTFGLLSMPVFLQSSILIISTCVYLAYLNVEIFILCLAWIIVVFLVNNFLMIKVHHFFRRSRDSDDALQNNYQNILYGHKELSINAYRARFYYENEFKKNASQKKKYSTRGNILNNLSNNWTNISLLALVGVQFYAAINFKLTSVENATTIALSVLFLRTPLVSVIGAVPTLLLSKIALDKITKLELEEYKADFEKVEKRPKWQALRFVETAFSYGENFKLNPVNLTIKKGELVFLIGKNGSGKSTFCMVLCGLFSPQSGAIFLDDEKVNEANLPSYRGLISAVFSDFHLFTQTLGDEDFADEEGINFWLNFLELENKTDVKDNELSITELSTGQKKRLAMMIALLEERDILVLDEWAADQDPVFRRFFYQRLLPLLKSRGKTIFAITHDDKYFDMADRILIAQNGSISELKGEDIKALAIDAVEKFHEEEKRENSA